ncbi:hypothetical protein ADK53_22580 [Streptomyces sp. WM6373]|uniref:hypothetical protein n=1 Tax=Streptomyces sp. WM6373 TaxID=1415556 RepID=UPI0006AF1055|nr:hypothetical protein [Streptomyces sp. WM6373]KOU32246.1 hypothetical protein ADK53_22580 [Streptomyces sp. WM6373]
MLTHTFDEGVLVVRLAPALGVRHRAAVTLAIEELLHAHRPAHLVVAAEGVWTPAVFSTVLRAHRTALEHRVGFAVVTAAPTAAEQLVSNSSGPVRVHRSLAQALSDARSQPAAPTGTGPRP